MAAGRYYWCIRHHGVEEAEGCKALDRLGPYDTRQEAEHALQRVAERNEQWEDDPDWNDRS